ncbi:MAG: hypothetical protein RIS47_506 [Bacteroidota bacterium]|jgi:radical SAM protein with 4Fe4S-binding SPASM domain
MFNLSYELVQNCNVSCKFCYNGWKNPLVNQTKISYSPQKAEETLERLFKKHFIRSLSLIGGEPLWVSNLERIVSIGYENYCSIISISSNGFGAPIARYKSLIGLGVESFLFPLHSANPQLHDELVGRKGAWNDAVRSLEFMAGQDVITTVNITAIRDNISEIIPIFELLRNRGISDFLVNRFVPGGAGAANWKALMPSVEESKYLMQQLDDYAAKHECNIYFSIAYPECVIPSASYPNLNINHCATPDSMPHIVDIEGNLRLCNLSPHNAGNLLTQNLDEILQSSYAQSWLEVPELCRPCALFDKCRAGCRAGAEQLGFTNMLPDPLVWTDFQRFDPA